MLQRQYASYEEYDRSDSKVAGTGELKAKHISILRSPSPKTVGWIGVSAESHARPYRAVSICQLPITSDSDYQTQLEQRFETYQQALDWIIDRSEDELGANIGIHNNIIGTPL